MNEAIRLTCPACGRYIGSIYSGYFEAPPCRCGLQTTVRIKRVDGLTIKPNPVTLLESK